MLIVLLGMVACGEKKSQHARIIFDKYDNGKEKVVHQFFTDTAKLSEDYEYQEFFKNGNLKLRGLENQRIRKGKWEAYYETGEVKATVLYQNDVPHGLITLYEKEGEVLVESSAKQGVVMTDHPEVWNLLVEDFSILERRSNWNDSMDVMIDSMQVLLKRMPEGNESQR